MDVLFIINFVMNLLVLFITNKVMKYSATFIRLALAATLGASWAVLTLIIPVHFMFLEKFCTYFVISALMIRICVKKNILKGVCFLYIVTFAVSGMFHMIYYYTYAGYFINTVILENRMLVILLILSVFIFAFIYKYIASVTTYNSKLYRVIIKIGEEKVDIMGFADTGNVLHDHLYNQPVCIAEKSLFKNVFEKIDDYTSIKYHMIPFHSLGCKNGIIEVIMVDIMCIYDGNKKQGITVKKNMLLGLSADKLSQDNAYQMLINCEVLK